MVVSEGEGVCLASSSVAFSRLHEGTEREQEFKLNPGGKLQRDDGGSWRKKAALVVGQQINFKLWLKNAFQ